MGPIQPLPDSAWQKLHSGLNGLNFSHCLFIYFSFSPSLPFFSLLPPEDQAIRGAALADGFGDVKHEGTAPKSCCSGSVRSGVMRCVRRATAPRPTRGCPHRNPAEQPPGCSCTVLGDHRTSCRARQGATSLEVGRSGDFTLTIVM